MTNGSLCKPSFRLPFVGHDIPWVHPKIGPQGTLYRDFQKRFLLLSRVFVKFIFG